MKNQNNITEQWKQIKGYKTYEVSNLGRIKSLPKLKGGKGGATYMTKERILKPQTTGSGYLQVRLFENTGDKGSLQYIHRLVGLHFLPETDIEDAHIHHIDNDKTNNVYTNIQWMSQYDHMIEFHRENFNNKLTRKDVVEIKYLLDLGMSQTKIGLMFDISQPTISGINTGRFWSDVIPDWECQASILSRLNDQLDMICK